MSNGLWQQWIPWTLSTLHQQSCSRSDGKSLSSFRSSLVKLDTCPALVEIFLMILKGQSPSVSPTQTDCFDTSISQAISSQSTIGWDAFRRGLISKAWGNVQHLYSFSKHQPTNTNIIRWMSQLIQSLWLHGKTMWEVRNISIHGSTRQESRKACLKRLLNQKSMNFTIIKIGIHPQTSKKELLWIINGI